MQPAAAQPAGSMRWLAIGAHLVAASGGGGGGRRRPSSREPPPRLRPQGPAPGPQHLMTIGASWQAPPRRAGRAARWWPVRGGAASPTLHTNSGPPPVPVTNPLAYQLDRPACTAARSPQPHPRLAATRSRPPPCVPPLPCCSSALSAWPAPTKSPSPGGQPWVEGAAWKVPGTGRAQRRGSAHHLHILLMAAQPATPSPSLAPNLWPDCAPTIYHAPSPQRLGDPRHRQHEAAAMPRGLPPRP